MIKIKYWLIVLTIFLLPIVRAACIPDTPNIVINTNITCVNEVFGRDSNITINDNKNLTLINSTLCIDLDKNWINTSSTGLLFVDANSFVGYFNCTIVQVLQDDGGFVLIFLLFMVGAVLVYRRRKKKKLMEEEDDG